MVKIVAIRVGDDRLQCVSMFLGVIKGMCAHGKAVTVRVMQGGDKNFFSDGRKFRAIVDAAGDTIALRTSIIVKRKKAGIPAKLYTNVRNGNPISS